MVWDFIPRSHTIPGYGREGQYPIPSHIFPGHSFDWEGKRDIAEDSTASTVDRSTEGISTMFGENTSLNDIISPPLSL